MTAATRLFNSAWMWQCRPEALRFARAAQDVERSQATVLQQILARNALAEFGRDHHFSRIRTAREYQDRVPVGSYETISHWIDRIAAGETGILTQEPVLMFEPTSGSSGPEKLIPYTRTLKRQFQRAICAWVYDAFTMRPTLRRGSSYWSLSPAFGGQRTTSGGLAIGFDDDSQYLSLPQRLASAQVLAVDPSVTRLASIENFRYATLLQLLQAPNLAVISIWSPTFLTTLLAKLDEWWPAICHDIRRGSVCWPAPNAVDSEFDRIVLRRRNPRRADYLTEIFGAAASSAEKLSRVWPTLGLISCWTDASAAQYLPELQTLFSNVEIQSKGLIATEGIVSIPRFGYSGTALAVRSHFFEFQEQCLTAEENGKGGPIQLAHELEAGHTYRVILTTGGGLYRYQLGDLIEVLGFWRECPLIRFLGRSMASSDLVGEKLHEKHVREVLDGLFAAEAITPRFSLLVPVAGTPPRYVLYLQGPDINSTRQLRDALAKRLQAGLDENPYYRHAVQLGQLAEARAIVLDPLGESAWQIFERVCVANGQKPGDIKPVALHPGTHWAKAFAGSEAVDDRAS